MILSVSRRTDIPAFYSDWFFDRLKEGFALVPSPFAANNKIAKVKLEPVKIETNLLGAKEVSGNVDGIVFWTKNPKPMMSRLHELGNLAYYFLFTLNAYDETIEANVPPLDERIKTFQELSTMLGADRVVWRYDPILFSNNIDVNWHVLKFEKLAGQLKGYTKNCKISFLLGKHNEIYRPNQTQIFEIAGALSQVAKANNIVLETCSEDIDFNAFGIKSSKCIDNDIFEKLLNAKAKSKKKDSGQRKECGCVPSIDIGIYNTCPHGCLYCYANGFYGYRGKPKSMLDPIEGETYERKTESVFNYL